MLRIRHFAKYFGLAAAAALLAGCGPVRVADVGVGYQMGPPPVCPYGYYDFAPYNCAPYGYYGPEWFNGGVFIGAGPWFQGPRRFHGRVDNHFDPHHGYHGAFPSRGEAMEHHPEQMHNFHGNERRDGRGHVMKH